MRRTTLIAVIVAALLVAGGGAWWLGRPTYDEVVKDCTAALKEQLAADGKGRPDACKDVKDDDYAAIVMHETMGREGWLDEDGRFDKNKMLEATLDDMP